MGAVTTLPRGRPLTRADLDTMPDDGHRYELVDGSLVVTPTPSTGHQGMLGQLHLLLANDCPPDLKVLFAPYDVVLADDTVVQPDLLVARRSDFTPRDLPGPPLLAVEVLSPSTRHIDLSLKRARYEAAGCPSYWVVDPEAVTVTVFELDNDVYVQRAHLSGEETYRANQPFPVTITPARLAD